MGRASRCAEELRVEAARRLGVDPGPREAGGRPVRCSGRAAVAWLACAVGVAAAAGAAAEVKVLSTAGCGRATGYAEANKIVTVGGKTHVAWLDSPAEGFRVRIRTLDHETGRWSPTYTVGSAHDNHGGPALAVDSKGYLHVAYYPHHHPMRYRRSKRPNDASAWTGEERFGRRCTYPTLVCGRDDTLYLTCRESDAGRWVANLYVKPPGKPWRKGGAILRARFGGYAHFQEALAWGPDHKTLHLSCRIYEGPGGRHQTVGYLVSGDSGRSWRRADGREVALPATAETVDVLASLGARKPQVEAQSLRCGAVAVDADGAPHVLYSEADARGARLVLARPDARGRWSRRSLMPAVAGTWPGCGLTMPGGLTFGGDGRLFAAGTLVRPDPNDPLSFWGHPSSEVVLIEKEARGRLEARMVSPPDPKVPHWLPNLERPTGHNRVDRPGVIFTAGTRGKKNTEVLSNKVCWARATGPERRGPGARRAAPGAEGIVSVEPDRKTVKRFGRLIVKIRLSGGFEDPYDPNEIRVDALIDPPASDGVVLPCFYRSGKGGDSLWEARFTPWKVGPHQARIQVRRGPAAETSAGLSFEVESSDADGFVRRHPTSPYLFVHDSGRCFRGVGINFAWEARLKLRDDPKYTYDYMLGVLRKRKANFVRTWMCPWNLPVQWNRTAYGRYTDDGRTFNASAIERMDRLVELAERNGIYLMLTLDYHGALKTKPDAWGGNNYWRTHPYNKANGGPCARPEEFFRSPEARRLYRNRLRYLIARWGYSPHVCVWELWNEVDHVVAEAKVPPRLIVDWHREMARYLKATDPYRRLVSTSVSHRPIEGLFDIEEIDFSQVHRYGATGDLPARIRAQRGKHGKPHVVGEFAHHWRSPGRAAGEAFVGELHLGLWRGMFSPTPVLPLTWWWVFFHEGGHLDHVAAAAVFQGRMLAGNAAPAELRVAGDDSLERMGLTSGANAFVWVRNRRDAEVDGASIAVPVARDAACTVTFYDTWRGRDLSTETRTAAGGTLRLRIPALAAGRDVAIAIVAGPARSPKRRD